MLSENYLTLLKRWVPLLLLGLVLGGLSGYVSASFIPETYRAEARLLVTPAQATTRQDLESAGLVAITLQELVTARPVLDRAAATSGVSVDDISEKLSTEAVPGTPLLKVMFDSRDPEQARIVTDAVARSLIDSPELKFATGAAILNVIDPAIAPVEPVSPRPLLNAAFGALLGLAAAAVLVALYRPADLTLGAPEAPRNPSRDDTALRHPQAPSAANGSGSTSTATRPAASGVRVGAPPQLSNGHSNGAPTGTTNES